MIDFFYNLGVFKSIGLGLGCGVIFALILMAIKTLIVLLTRSNLHIPFIELPFMAMYMKRVMKYTPVFYYSPVVDSKNLTLSEALKKEEKGWDNQSINNPLQLKDDDFITNRNLPYIYFNPETLEVYGSYIMVLSNKYKTKYFSAKLVLKNEVAK
ncbi:hypothetical protein [Acinetobacter baumannii]|uniref:hypothetical protein n=1 Tax=Acinetobacter baumannii TaxID=470 RepID=UPI000DF37FBB|nr:hypothetical protein [Acinetobacter baumannii]RCT89690.1 hypothetical protein DVA68_15945 [Acinetobacter baumannii]